MSELNLTLTLNIELSESTKQFFTNLFSGSVQPTAVAPKPEPKSVAVASKPASAPEERFRAAFPKELAEAPAVSAKAPELPTTEEKGGNAQVAISPKQKVSLQKVVQPILNDHRDEILEIVRENSITLPEGGKYTMSTIRADRFESVLEKFKALDA